MELAWNWPGAGVELEQIWNWPVAGLELAWNLHVAGVKVPNWDRQDWSWYGTALLQVWNWHRVGVLQVWTWHGIGVLHV